MPVKTHYARNGEFNLAYQVTGSGPVDLLLIAGFVSHLELDWTDSADARFLNRLGSFSRLIRMDKRGTGLSDPAPTVPTLEERMEDVHAVLDAAGSERAALLGFSEGGPTVLLFAATYPERTSALILYGSFPSGPGLPSEVRRKMLESVEQSWGDGAVADILGPGIANDPVQRKAVGLYERMAASPGMARSLVQALERIDVTDILPSIRVPTLVLHRTGDVIPVEGARQMAERIPNSRFVEFEGDNHWMSLGDTEPILGEIEEFLTGARTRPPAERALATVLLTDIVASTDRIAEVGDTAWRHLLDAHNELVRATVEEHRGKPIKSTGDGFLATFDGPAQAIEAARALRGELTALGIEIRAAVHTGECELIEGDIAGMAVNICARISSLAGPGEILVSSTVTDLVVGSQLEFVDHGEHQLKGVPRPWRVFVVAESEGSATPPIADARSSRIGDKATVAVARRAPGMLRALGRAISASSRRG